MDQHGDTEKRVGPETAAEVVAPATASATAAPTPATEVPRWRVYVLFTIAVLGSAIGGLSQTAVNAMITIVGADLGVGVDVSQWLTSAYILTIGVTVPLAAYFAKRVCMRHHLILGLTIFAIGSLVDWIAADFAVMLVGRILQATSMGILMPLIQNIAMTQFPPARRGTAMGVSGIALGAAPNIGPTVGGLMEAAFGWRSLFVFQTVFGVVFVLLTLAFVLREEPFDKTVQFETVSFVFSSIGFGGVLLGLSVMSTFGIASLYVWIPMIVGIVFVVLFVKRQRKVASPLVNMDIFASKQYVYGAITLSSLFASFMGVTLVIPLYVQNLCGGTPLDVGLIMLPPTIIAFIMNPVSGIMADRFGTRPVVILFAVFVVLGAALWLFIDETTPMFVLMIFQSVRGFGVSGAISPCISWSLAKLEHRIIPDGSSSIILLRQTAASFGTAMMVFAIESSLLFAAEIGMPALPYQLAFGVSLVFALITFTMVVRKVR